MAPTTLEQFTSMLNSCFSLGATNSDQSPMTRTIRETVSYPKVRVTVDDNACLDPSRYFDHVLSCGHLINTALPNEPCAPNCHHAAGKADSLDKSLNTKNALKMKNGQSISIKEFYCDACVETRIETMISSKFSSANAEDRRATLRIKEATELGKATKYRKCYIAQKNVSIPCHSDGSLSSRYKPREEHHPFDTSLPQIGENMFEDVDLGPETVTSKTMEQTEERTRKADSAFGDVSTGRESRDLSAEVAVESRPTVKASRRSAGRAYRQACEANRNVGIAASQRPRRKRTYRDMLDEEDNLAEEDDEGDEDAPPVKRKRTAPMVKKAAKKKTEGK